MSDFIKMVSVLFIACGLAAGSLAIVDMVTKEPIANLDKKQKEVALREVFTTADEFKELTANKVWEARNKGQKVGDIFLTEVQGYSGPITLMFGVGSDNAITGFKVLNHTETPGLGAKITTPQFRDQFKNKRLEQIILKKDNPGQGAIDAITAATISSRAVTRAVSSTLESFMKEKGGENK
jgi:electron transport complex protein RnfG